MVISAPSCWNGKIGVAPKEVRCFWKISGISTTFMAIWLSTGLTGNFGYLESASNDLAEELARACNGLRSS